MITDRELAFQIEKVVLGYRIETIKESAMQLKVI